MRIIIILGLAISGAWVRAVEIEKVNFPDTVTVRGKQLVLNGAALRTKRKFGINFKVYVAAFWVPRKSSDPALLMEPGDKVVELVFLRSLDKETLREAWPESFKANCQIDCENGLKLVEQFNSLMVDVKNQSRLRMTFDKDGVDVEITGKSAVNSGRIAGAAFTRNLIAAFIGPKPATEELKKGLLGLASE